MQSGGRLSRSMEDALLEVPFQPIRFVGFVEEGLDSEWYLTQYGARCEDLLFV